MKIVIREYPVIDGIDKMIKSTMSNRLFKSVVMVFVMNKRTSNVNEISLMVKIF